MASGSAAGEASGEPGAPAPTEVPPPSRPPGKWAVDGVSLSDVDALDLLRIFKQAKLTDSSGVGTVPGRGYESVSFPVSRGKLQARFYMVRPAKVDTPAESSLGGPEVALGLKDEARAFGVHDEQADLYFEIRLDEGGKATDAKAMLDAVIRASMK